MHMRAASLDSPLCDNLTGPFGVAYARWLLLVAATDQKALWGTSLHGLKQEAKLLTDTQHRDSRPAGWKMAGNPQE